MRLQAAKSGANAVNLSKRRGFALPQDASRLDDERNPHDISLAVELGLSSSRFSISLPPSAAKPARETGNPEKRLRGVSRNRQASLGTFSALGLLELAFEPLNLRTGLVQFGLERIKLSVGGVCRFPSACKFALHRCQRRFGILTLGVTLLQIRL